MKEPHVELRRLELNNYVNFEYFNLKNRLTTDAIAQFGNRPHDALQ
jgi:hypothetical protein